MFTLPAFVGSLPPASLAKADLARFIVRALGRRSGADLPELHKLVEGATLVGYPAVIGPILTAFIERLMAVGRDPANLDPDVASHILGTPPFLRSVASRVDLEQIILRPGMPVSAEVRVLLDGRLVTLRGVGPQLVLISPVEVIRLPGMTWSVLRSVPLARAMTLDEMEELRAAWASIEERVPWPSDPARVWEARFVEIAVRGNDDAAACVDVLRGLTPFQRRKAWRGLVEHLRDQELPEDHRPGPRGIQQRMDIVGADLKMDAIAVLKAVAESAYASCAIDGQVQAGYCPCRSEDLDRYCRWMEVPEASRERLGAMTPELVCHGLRTLAAMDTGLLQVDLGEETMRDLRGLRDAYLKQRYRRDVSVLLGIDPLGLVEERLAAGEDRTAISRALEGLVKKLTSEVAVLDSPKQQGPSLRDLLRLDPRMSKKESAIQSKPLPRELPPLPKPPPASRPLVRRRTELPPLPDIPPPSPQPRLSDGPVLSSDSIVDEAAPGDAVRGARPRSPTLTRPVSVPHLVTPAQGSEFYESAFREMEVLERDLLERGPWQEAIDRVTLLSDQAGTLAGALGPAARSGDDAFRSSLRKVELVQAYIDRIRPLLSRDRPLPTVDEAHDDGVMDRLGKLFKGD